MGEGGGASRLGQAVLIILLVILISCVIGMLIQQATRLSQLGREVNQCQSANRLRSDQLRDLKSQGRRCEQGWKDHATNECRPRTFATSIGTWSYVATPPPDAAFSTDLSLANQPPDSSVLAIPYDAVIDAFSIQVSSPITAGTVTLALTVDNVLVPGFSVDLNPTSQSSFFFETVGSKVTRTSVIGIAITSDGPLTIAGSTWVVSVEPWGRVYPAL